MTISIILPVYNEVKSLEYVVSNWSKYLEQKKIIHEFVICEDGSTDGTKELIKILEKNYSISNQSVKNRRGYGQGVIAGIKAAQFEFILCIDSDGQCMPDSFEEFLKNKNAADILIGNRKPRNDPIIRIIYSKLFKYVHDFLFKSKIKDPSCPYVFAKKNIFLSLIHKLTYMREGFWWGFVGAAKMVNLKFYQIDIVHFQRYDGSTVVYKFSKMPMIIIRNIIGLIKLKNSF
ncbi:glycosyltransferase family 2 protein [Candidatus Pelagibacter sp.]|nr:glycosyltransferase family 2 protein [Candidatus Pelagibacter sp.]